MNAVENISATQLSIDLVVCTIERTSEITRFFDALAKQSHKSFRAIVVDQNSDDRIERIVEEYRRLVPIVRVVSSPGLSRARNIGLRNVRADIVAFADDDCWYAPDLLTRVSRTLAENPKWDGLTGRIVDVTGRSSSARWSRAAGPISRFNVWTRGVSGTVFLRKRVVDAVGRFDESLGLGAGTGFGSGEETDYLVRALDAGSFLYYDPTLTVFHPDNRREFDPRAVASGRTYGAGMGRVLRKHYPWWFGAYHCVRALGGAGLALCTGRPDEARFYWAVARGRFFGWFAPADLDGPRDKPGPAD